MSELSVVEKHVNTITNIKRLAELYLLFEYPLLSMISGSRLVLKAIRGMIADDCDEVNNSLFKIQFIENTNTCAASWSY